MLELFRVLRSPLLYLPVAKTFAGGRPNGASRCCLVALLFAGMLVCCKEGTNALRLRMVLRSMRLEGVSTDSAAEIDEADEFDEFDEDP